MMNLKKIGAILLAVMMMAMAGVSNASSTPEDMTGESGVIGEFTQPDTPTTKVNQLKIYQEITAYNKDGKTVNAPTVTYTYTITGLAGGKQIKDAGGAALHNSELSSTIMTKDASSTSIGGAATITGTGNGVLALTPADQLAASDNGTANRFPLTIDFSGCTWTGAGVYRFRIDETTTPATKIAAGILEGTTSNTRYIDVYVKDKTGGGYEIYGYTCLSDNVDIDGTNTASLTAAGKTEGFVGSKEDEQSYTSENESVADKYYTFNLTVGKTLAGDSANNDHDFPFTVKFANTTVTSAVIIKLELSENGGTATTGALAQGTLSTATTGITDSNRGIDHESTVMYIGIPVGIDAATTAEVYEVNDVTGTTYLSQYSLQGATLTGDKKIDWNSGTTSTSNTAEMPDITKAVDDNVSHTIQFTNTLELISPTGYVARYAPYALMLIGGIVLLIIAKKHKKHSEED